MLDYGANGLECPLQRIQPEGEALKLRRSRPDRSLWLSSILYPLRTWMLGSPSGLTAGAEHDEGRGW